MRIICVGDSNTYGYDPRSYLGSRYPGDIRWTDQLGDHTVINFGMNGMTVLRAKSVFADRVRMADPDLIIVMLGTNDIIVGAGAEETCERMDSFLSSIMVTGKPVLLIAPPTLEYGDWVMDGEQIEESELLQDLYRDLASERGCMYANAGEWGIDLAFDGVHFLPEGHRKFAERLKTVIV